MIFAPFQFLILFSDVPKTLLTFYHAWVFTSKVPRENLVQILVFVDTSCQTVINISRLLCVILRSAP